MGAGLLLTSGVADNAWPVERNRIAPILPLVLSVDRSGAVNYGPYHYDGQSPSATACLPDQQIIDDLGKIDRANFQFLRTYAVDNCLNNIVPLARKHYPQLKLYVGVHVSSVDHDNPDNPHSTRWQLNEAVRLANLYDNVAGVVVGNECLNDDGGGQKNTVSVDQLIKDLNYAGANLLPERRRAVQVTTAMTWAAAVDRYAELGAKIKDHCDLIMVNVFPFWAGAPTLELACSNFDWAYGMISDTYRSTGKPVAIGETGWPSEGSCVTGTMGTACPGLERAKGYIECVVNYARKQRIVVFLFEMFDEPWKTAEGDFGPHWGLYDKNGNPKF
jgi:exo-beta-1,3-glucanase (GH17 family)